MTPAARPSARDESSLECEFIGARGDSAPAAGDPDGGAADAAGPEAVVRASGRSPNSPRTARAGGRDHPGTARVAGDPSESGFYRPGHGPPRCPPRPPARTRSIRWRRRTIPIARPRHRLIILLCSYFQMTRRFVSRCFRKSIPDAFVNPYTSRRGGSSILTATGHGRRYPAMNAWLASEMITASSWLCFRFSGNLDHSEGLRPNSAHTIPVGRGKAFA